MALELNGTTGVSLVQDGVVTAADLASGAITASALPSGTIVQYAIAQFEPGGDVSTTSSSYQEVSTNLRVSFQMLNTSNKVILRCFSASAGYITGSSYCSLDVQDISSGAFTSDSMVFIGPAGSIGVASSGTRVVSGATWGSGSRTVSLYFKSSTGGNTVYANWAGSAGLFSVEVMEVAA